MPKIGYISTSAATMIDGVARIKRVYIVAHVKPYDYTEIETKSCCFLADPTYHDRQEQIDYYKSIVEYAKTLTDEDVILFQCHFGQNRSFECASVLADLLGNQHVWAFIEIDRETISCIPNKRDDRAWIPFMADLVRKYIAENIS